MLITYTVHTRTLNYFLLTKNEIALIKQERVACIIMLKLSLGGGGGIVSTNILLNSMSYSYLQQNLSCSTP